MRIINRFCSRAVLLTGFILGAFSLHIVEATIRDQAEVQACLVILQRLAELNRLNGELDRDYRDEAHLPIALWIDIQGQRLQSADPITFDVGQATVPRNHWVIEDARGVARRIRYEVIPYLNDKIKIRNLLVESGFHRYLEKIERILMAPQFTYQDLEDLSRWVILANHSLLEFKSGQTTGVLEAGEGWKYHHGDIGLFHHAHRKFSFHLPLPMKGTFGFSPMNGIAPYPIGPRGVSSSIVKGDDEILWPVPFARHDDYHAFETASSLASCCGSGWLTGHSVDDYKVVLAFAELEHLRKKEASKISSPQTREAVEALVAFAGHELIAYSQFSAMSKWAGRLNGKSFGSDMVKNLKSRSHETYWGRRESDDIDAALLWIEQFYEDFIVGSSAFEIQVRHWFRNRDIKYEKSSDADWANHPTVVLDHFAERFFGNNQTKALDYVRRTLPSILPRFNGDAPPDHGND